MGFPTSLTPNKSILLYKEHTIDGWIHKEVLRHEYRRPIRSKPTTTTNILTLHAAARTLRFCDFSKPANTKY